MAVRTKPKPDPKLELTQQLATERMRVDFDSYDITVQQLIAMIESKQIDVAPAYQRQFRWDLARQSQLIESIFLGIPVPNLFMAANADGTWEVVDGVQRISTIVHFAGDPKSRASLALKDSLQLDQLEKLGLLNGVRFADLPTTLQTQFLLRPVKVTTLSDKSDKKVRFDLFERLNTGGVRLTAQEIRGCIYRGPFNEFLESMAKNEDFHSVVLLREASEGDGTREEYALRFFAFFHRYKKFEHSVVEFLNDYMADASESFAYAREEERFKKTFAELARLFPDGITRRRRVTPVNLYEAVAVGAAVALESSRKLRGPVAPAWVDSDDLKALTSIGTNNRRMVIGRIEYAAGKFGAA